MPADPAPPPQDVRPRQTPPHLRLPLACQAAIRSALEHDVLNLAQSTAYSAIFALFPTLIVTAAIAALLPYTVPLRYELSALFGRILPSDVSPLLASYFRGTHSTVQSNQALTIAAIVSTIGATSVIATFMEGIRRANNLPLDDWTFLQRRLRALLLVPLCLLPLTVASSLVVFGHLLTVWLGAHVAEMVRPAFYIAALLLRWTVALAGSVGLIAVLYHMGTPLQQRWSRTIPGALVSTLMWFVSTLAFGWYVTRFANYGRVYGPLGAGIALLVWLYLIALSVLYGAEFNAHFFLPQPARSSASSPIHNHNRQSPVRMVDEP